MIKKSKIIIFFLFIFIVNVSSGTSKSFPKKPMKGNNFNKNRHNITLLLWLQEKKRESKGSKTESVNGNGSIYRKSPIELLKKKEENYNEKYNKRKEHKNKAYEKREGSLISD